jgi:hypothetical protein
MQSRRGGFDEAGAREHLHATEVHLLRRPQRADEGIGDPGEVEADRPGRLTHEVHGAELEAAEREVDAALRRRGTEHHHRSRCLAHDVAERLNAVELGHLHVERDDVGIQGVDLLECVEAVAGRADDAELPRAVHDLRDETAHERAVVHHEDRGLGLR